MFGQIEKPVMLPCDLHIFAKMLSIASTPLTEAEETRCDDLFDALSEYLDATFGAAWEYVEAMVP